MKLLRLSIAFLGGVLLLVSCSAEQQPQRLPFVYILQLQEGGAEKVMALAQTRGIDTLVLHHQEISRYTPPIDIAALHKAGTEVLLYVNVGNVEKAVKYPEGDWAENPYEAYGVMADPGWPGEMYAAYWHPEYRALITAMLKSAAATGADGLYFDNIDKHYQFSEADEQGQLPEGRSYPSDFTAAMQTFLIEVISELRQDFPNLRIYLQNGEELASNPELLHVVDGIGIEDLLQPELEGDLHWREEQLARFKGKEILLTEYSDDPAMQQTILEYACHRNWPVFIAREDRLLDVYSVEAGVRALENMPESGCNR